MAPRGGMGTNALPPLSLKWRWEFVALLPHLALSYKEVSSASLSLSFSLSRWDGIKRAERSWRHNNFQSSEGGKVVGVFAIPSWILHTVAPHKASRSFLKLPSISRYCTYETKECLLSLHLSKPTSLITLLFSGECVISNLSELSPLFLYVSYRRCGQWSSQVQVKTWIPSSTMSRSTLPSFIPPT